MTHGGKGGCYACGGNVIRLSNAHVSVVKSAKLWKK